MSPQETKESKGVGEMLGGAGTTVKEGVVGSLKGLNEIGTQIVNLAGNTMTDVLKATGSVANETINVSKDVFKGALKATEEVGTGLLVTTKDVAKGIILGVADVGGDVAQVAKAAAGGAIDAAGTLGQSAVKAVSGILVGAVAGVKDVVGAAWPKSKAGLEAPAEAKPAAPETPPERKTAGGKGESAAKKPDKDEKWTPA
jgi:hypothetical protein